MLKQIAELIATPQFMFAVLVAIGVSATIITLALPLLEKDQLKTRMRSVAIERERIRMRERARLAAETKVSLRNEPKAYMRELVERFNLKNALADERTTERLRMAGLRGQAPITVFLFARFVLPIGIFVAAIFYFFVLAKMETPTGMRIAYSVVLAGIGLYLPNIWLQNTIQKRQVSIRQAWPDALDLTLICVESGMSIEAAFRKVAEEIGTSSIPLAEEMSLTCAELSYLQERRKAYENLALRTGLEPVKGVVTALIQAERYGTPLGQALRVLAQESRDTRMAEAEKKAAALPPKLTVPMIVFFLPVLFVVIMGPAMIQILKLN
ncbi:type II secretion system F family protein [Prosthecomicrobium sp. N25]|uniref:type II secretion system F family protein n=1 Tax=Prosthecomicrobium sp. N25 TaxID=3129254 RepID=UPI0030777E0D